MSFLPHLLMAGIMSFLLVAPTRSESTSDLEELMRIFPGVYDNVEQYESEAARGVNPAERHMRYTSYIVPQQLQILTGRRNLYIQQWVDGNVSRVSRQRLYSFAQHPDTAGITMRIYRFSNTSSLLNAPPNASDFWNLQESDVKYVNGCDVTWIRRKESPSSFFSSMADACFVKIHGQKVQIQDSNDLTASYLTIHETWVFENGTELTFHALPYNLTKQNFSTENYFNFNKGGDSDNGRVQVWVTVVAVAACSALVAFTVLGAVLWCRHRRQNPSSTTCPDNSTQVEEGVPMMPGNSKQSSNQ